MKGKGTRERGLGKELNILIDLRGSTYSGIGVVGLGVDLRSSWVSFLLHTWSLHTSDFTLGHFILYSSLCSTNSLLGRLEF